MASPGPTPTGDDVTAMMSQWRELMATRPGLSDDDVDELADHLDAEVADLQAAGLAPDEAFLIAVRRMGAQDDVSRQYARVHADRLWRQLVPAAPDPHPPGRVPGALGLPGALVIAVCTGLAVRLPYTIFGDAASNTFYPRNAAFLVLPLLIVYFLMGHWRGDLDTPRGLHRLGGAGGLAVLTATFLVPGILINLFPAHPSGQTFWLSALHLPVTLGVATGIAYLGPRWNHLRAWMDWVRFLGEAAVYYILIALCGGVLTGLVGAIFSGIGLPEATIEEIPAWVIPLGAGGAVPVCAWLVGRKKAVIENMAPVLTGVFTPLMGTALAAFVVVVAASGGPVHADRDVLIIFDAVLIAVAAIVGFTVSARDPQSHRHALDWMQLALCVLAVAADLLMLWAMAGRLGQWGASPNKLAGLGCNMLLLAHLSGSGWHYCRICLERASARASRSLERWQCVALPTFAAWALVVAVVFPPLFGWN